ncbi:uncharacterized protein [Montipora foliosa]|uniref:uncharacterized protein n=1 Tax=Montipora foliosa TaxID=591990 RepID=UPI0035F1E0BF
MEAVLKELAELRSVNQKLNDRLDAMCKSKAKKSVFSSKQRSSTSVDPSCSDAVRKTYRELRKQREDFAGFLTSARLVHVDMTMKGTRRLRKLLSKKSEEINFWKGKMGQGRDKRN